MIKKLSIILVILIAPFQYANAIELEEALALAYNNNPSLKSMRAHVMSVDETAPTALGGFLPRASASYQRGKLDSKFGTSETNRINDTKEISFSQPIFRGGASISALNQAKDNIKSARESLMQTEQEVLLDAITAYMNIVRDQEVLELARNNLNVMQKHLDVTNERFNFGEVTKTDVAQSEAAVARAMAEKISAEGALEASSSFYERVVGEKPVGVTMPELKIAINYPVNDLIELSKTGNPGIKALNYQKYAAEGEIKKNKASLLPSVDLNASKQKQKGALFGGGNDIDSTSIGFSVSIPLYQSGAEYSRVRQSVHEVTKIEYDIEEQINRVKEQIVSSYQQHQVANSSIASNEAEIEATQIALDGTEKEAKIGSRTILDVLDAEQELFQAKTNLVRSKRDKIVSAYTLLALIGNLNAGELGLAVDFYDPEKHYDDVKYQIIGF